MYCTLEESLEPASHSQLFNLLEKLALLVLMVSQWDIQWSVTNNWSWKRPHYIVVSCSVQEALMPSVKLPAVTVVWVELIRKTLIELLHMQQTLLLSLLIFLHNKLKKGGISRDVFVPREPPTKLLFPEGHFKAQLLWVGTCGFHVESIDFSAVLWGFSNLKSSKGGFLLNYKP